MKKYDRAKCILAAFFSAKQKNYEELLDDSRSRISSLGGKVVGTIYQRRGASRSKKPGGSKRLNIPLDRRTLFSKGKIEELKEKVVEGEVNMVVFYNELSHSQVLNLERELGVEVLSLDSISLRWH